MQRAVLGLAAVGVAWVLFAKYPKHIVVESNPRYDPSFTESMIPDSLNAFDRLLYEGDRRIPTLNRHRPDAAEVVARYVAPIALGAVGLFVVAGGMRKGSRP